MATLSSTVSLLSAFSNPSPRPLPPVFSFSPGFNRCVSFPFSSSSSSAVFRFQVPLVAVSSPQPCADEPSLLDKSLLCVEEAVSEQQLWSAACLRVRTFNEFKDSFGIEDHKKYLAEREYEALKERVAGTREGSRRVSCISATLPLSHLSNSRYADLCRSCKFSTDEGERVIVATLDVNNCLRLPDEITGMRPQGIGSDFARAYLSNVCVAKELQRNGLGSSLILKSKAVAEEWGMTDLYVHVAVDNEAAKKLYMKSGFSFESDEPAWQARYLNRPRRILLWMGLSDPYHL
ncbi:hypothetical protein V2J09_017846 [Rumex salicifolius]